MPRLKTIDGTPRWRAHLDAIDRLAAEPGWWCPAGGAAWGWADVRLGEDTMKLWLTGEEIHDDPALGLRSVRSYPTGLVPAASRFPGG